MKIFFPKIPFIKRILPRSLFARSLLILTVPIILTLSISTYIFFNRHWDSMAQRLASAVAGDVGYVVDQVQENHDDKRIEKLKLDSLAYLQINIAYVESGKIIAEPVAYLGRSNLIKDILDGQLRKKVSSPYHILVDTEEKWIQVQVQLDSGALIMTLPQGRLFSSSGYIFLMWMIGVSSILLVVATLFMRNQIRPIKRLAIAAERFGKGREVPFFKVEGAREVRQAARAFLGMRERINKQIQQRTAMLAGVSHDLRTPLTRMKLQVEMMPEGADKKDLRQDVEDMQRMIDAYLQFARGEGNEEMERVDLLDLLSRLKQNFARQGFDVNVESTGKNFSTILRPVAFERCLNNILSNAQKYAPQAWVSLQEDDDDNLKIIIDDNGCGIQEGNYDDVFKPFFREEKSRNTKSGGVGLGLPIAQDIILAHGGDITLSKSPKGGVRVSMTLPV